MALLDNTELRAALPDKVRKSVTQEVLDGINQVIHADPGFYENYRNNLISYGHVMQDGKFKLTSYVDAVRYVSYKLMGLTNQDAYIKTFPQKYQYFLNKGASAKDISSYVHAYHNNKLVNLIMEQTMIPIHVLGQDYFWKALKVQVELMTTAASEKVRSDAANSVMNTLKPPETKKHEVAITHKDDGTLASLRAATEQLVQAQREAIASGKSTAGDIAGGRIIEGEVIES